LAKVDDWRRYDPGHAGQHKHLFTAKDAKGSKGKLIAIDALPIRRVE
jgi:hypothetical protein